MKASVKDNEFVPLLGALKKIQFSLESTSSPRVMLAAPTMEEFCAQQLPSHCNVMHRKIHGPRVRVRGRRRASQPSVIAHWPNDGLVEGTSPALLFVLDGQADIPIADYVVHCHVGDVLFFPSGIIQMDGSRPHYEKITPEAHCDLLFISFLPIGLHSLQAYICHSKGDRHIMSNAGEICWIASRAMSLIFDTISEIAQHGGSTKSSFHLTVAMVSFLKQEIEQGKCFSIQDFPSRSVSLDDCTPISKAVEYMQNHLYTSLSIDLVARWVGLSRSVFIKQFREETNESFQEHLTKLRLEQSKVLLLQTKLPIEHISERAGLSSGQLRNLFQKRYQCTPREFRRNPR